MPAELKMFSPELPASKIVFPVSTAALPALRTRLARPPPELAELPLIVQLAIVSVALPAFWARLQMPPPEELAELPLIVQLAIVSVALPSESAMLPTPPP